jgi:hypothetical protein
MKSLFPLLLAILTAIGCGPNEPQSQLHDTSVESYYDELGMRPGVGMDSLLHDVRGECVQFDGWTTAGNSQEASFDFRMIEGHQALFSHLGISTKIQVRAAASTSETPLPLRAQFALGDGIGISKYSAFILVSAKIRNETSFLKKPRLTADAAALLKQAGTAGFDAFRRRCGDGFLVGLTTGAEFYAVIEVETNTDEELQRLRTSIHSQRDEDSSQQSQVQLNKNLRQLGLRQNIRIRTYQRGGAGESEIGMVQSIDQLLGRLKELADFARNGQNPRPITGTLTDYMTLGLEIPAAQLQKLSHAQDVIDELGKRLAALADLKANLVYILAHHASFVGMNGQKLTEINHALSQIDQRVGEIRSAAKNCSSNYETCQLPKGIEPPPFELPKRRRDLTQLENEKLHISTKIHYLDVYAISDSLSQPECYLQLNVGRHGDDKFITVLRTETTYETNRCRNLQTDMNISAGLIRDAFAQLGVRPEQGWIEVQAFEDDPWYPDLLGSTYISFSQLDSGAVIKGIHTTSMNLQVNFELQD